MAYIGVSPSNGVRRVHTYTATASQTTFSGAGAEGTSLSYKDSNFVDVYQNGIKLGDADYTSTSGTSIVLAQGASVDDLVVVVVFDVFSVADTVSKADGGTFDGNVTMGGTLGVTGATTLTGALTGTTATFSTADNNAQLTLISTDTDANRGPILALTRNSGSPADNDIGGTIKFNAKNDASEDIELFEINTTLIDASDGTEDARMIFNGIIGGASTNRLSLNSNEVVFNDDGADVDFRVEGDTNTHALFVQAGSNGVGIGNDSPNSFGANTDNLVIGTTSGENGMTIVSGTANSGRIQFADNTSDPFRGAIEYAHGSTDALFFYTNGSQQLKIASTGIITNGSTASNTTSASANMVVTSGGEFAKSTSSKRYKNTINDATHGLTELLKLRSVTYKGNKDGDTIFGGLIAEEVHDAGLTEFVQYDDEDKPESLHYTHMIALCIKAIQELSTKVTALETENKTQATQIADLISRVTALENAE